MIVLNYQNSDRIEGLHPLFKTLFDYVKSHDLLRTALGRIDVMGDDLFIMNVEADAVLAEQQVLELHHQYIMCISCWKVVNGSDGKLLMI